MGITSVALEGRRDMSLKQNDEYIEGVMDAFFEAFGGRDEAAKREFEAWFLAQKKQSWWQEQDQDDNWIGRNG